MERSVGVGKMKPVKRLLKLHKDKERWERLRRLCTDTLRRNKAEMKKLLLNIPDNELLAYGELVGYLKTEEK